jgi:hypothetical protein
VFSHILALQSVVVLHDVCSRQYLHAVNIDPLEVPNQAIHNEGAVGAVPAKLIAVYVVVKGKPLVSPVKQLLYN